MPLHHPITPLVSLGRGLKPVISFAPFPDIRHVAEGIVTQATSKAEGMMVFKRRR
jgi:hypothetical protein